MKKIILLAGLFLAGHAVAGEYDALVQRAFDSLSDDFHHEWAFTESLLEDELIFVGRFDPRLPDGERWTLLSVDGRQPTDEELDDYLDDKEDEYQGDDDEDHDNEIDMIDFESLELIEETDDHWVFSFIPNGDDDEDEEEQEFMTQVTATIKIVRDGHYLEYIDLRNEKTIKPAFSVRITKFLTRLTFGPAAGDGPIVPQSMDVMIKGRALLLVTFDEKESIRYSDYEYAGD